MMQSRAEKLEQNFTGDDRQAEHDGHTGDMTTSIGTVWPDLIHRLLRCRTEIPIFR